MQIHRLVVQGPLGMLTTATNYCCPLPTRYVGPFPILIQPSPQGYYETQFHS